MYERPDGTLDPLAMGVPRSWAECGVPDHLAGLIFVGFMVLLAVLCCFNMLLTNINYILN